MTVQVSLPEILTDRDWDLLVGAGQTSVTLPAQGGQELQLRLIEAADFSPADSQAGDAITVTAEVEGIPVGGMT